MFVFPIDSQHRYLERGKAGRRRPHKAQTPGFGVNLEILAAADEYGAAELVPS